MIKLNQKNDVITPHSFARSAPAVLPFIRIPRGPCPCFMLMKGAAKEEKTPVACEHAPGSYSSYPLVITSSHPSRRLQAWQERVL